MSLNRTDSLLERLFFRILQRLTLFTLTGTTGVEQWNGLLGNAPDLACTDGIIGWKID